jgi:hypothetical protein
MRGGDIIKQIKWRSPRNQQFPDNKERPFTVEREVLFTVDVIEKLPFDILLLKPATEKSGAGFAVRVTHTP